MRVLHVKVAVVFQTLEEIVRVVQQSLSLLVVAKPERRVHERPQRLRLREQWERGEGNSSAGGGRAKPKAHTSRPVTLARTCVSAGASALFHASEYAQKALRYCLAALCDRLAASSSAARTLELTATPCVDEGGSSGLRHEERWLSTEAVDDLRETSWGAADAGRALSYRSSPRSVSSLEPLKAPAALKRAEDDDDDDDDDDASDASCPGCCSVRCSSLCCGGASAWCWLRSRALLATMGAVSTHCRRLGRFATAGAGAGGMVAGEAGGEKKHGTTAVRGKLAERQRRRLEQRCAGGEDKRGAQQERAPLKTIKEWRRCAR